MNYRLASTVGAILAASAAQSAYAQQAASGGGLEEVVVTAQRRTENLQDVPIAITALTGETLSQLKVATIDDYIKYLPSVTTANLGPGQGNIYMRGLSVGALGTQGQASVGAWPNVAVYLDEQSTQIPGRNLDVYAADLERIEVLEGPQGTLFGAGAQAGVLRYITNKPNLDRTEFKATAGYSDTAHGNSNSNLEGVLNLPIIDGKLAARVVVYNDSRGGYIDNVPSTFTRRGTDLGLALRNGGTVVNGVVTSPGQVPEDSLAINNYNIAQKDINSVNYKGVRAGLKWQINDTWDALITQTFQEMEAHGVFYQLPNGSEGQKLDDLEVTLFNNGYTHDKFENTALTISGGVGSLGLVYAGAYLVRDSEQIQDYTNYARGVWGTYYQCDGFSIGYMPTTKCYTPSATWHDKTHNVNMSHEIRLSSPDDWRLRFVTGAFYEKRELNDQTDWLYKSLPECPDSGVSTGSCFLYLDPTQSPKFQSASMNNRNRRNSSTGFLDDFQRTYTQTALFASVDFDILDNLTLTLGTRYYDISNEMLGANMGSFYCKVYSDTAFNAGASGPCNGTTSGWGGAPGPAPQGTHLDEQNPHKDSVDGFKSRANLTWKVTDDALLYATWSEGYRPGGFNRGSNCYLRDVDTGVKQWCVPKAYASDDLTNIEFGWKTMFFDRRLQFNGAIYNEKWKDVQTGIFAPQLGLGNLTVGLNGPEYEVNGIEMQITAVPVDGLTVDAAASYNKSKLTNSPALTNNVGSPETNPNYGDPISEACLSGSVVAGDFVCSQVVDVVNVFGKKGDKLANSPELQWNIRARYEWDMGEYRPFVMGAVQYQDGSFSSATEVNQYEMPSWTTFDASIGVNKDEWNAELYVVNLTDENKSVFTSAAQFIVAEVPMRPRTIGLRIGYAFGK
jgi:outer membrane receptor protein involved in Fe transport